MARQGKTLHFYLLLLSSSSSAVHSMARADRSQGRLLSFLNDLFQNCILLEHCSVSVHVEKQLWRDRFFTDNYFTEFLKTSENASFVLKNGIGDNTRSQTRLKLFFFKSESSVLKIIKQIQSDDSSSMNFKYLLVFLYEAPWPEREKSISNIFQHFFSVYIVDITVVIHDKGSLKAFTFYPFSKHGCNRIEPVLLENIFLQNGRVNPRNVFPKKFADFHGCPLKVVTWLMAPFVTLKWNTNSQSLEFYGYDIELLRFFASQFNFSLNIELNQPADLRGGDIFENGTITGAYKIVRDREANISIGCSTCKPERMAILSPSLPYYSMEYVLVVGTAKADLDFKIFFAPFDSITWALFCTFLLIWIIFRTLAKRYKDLSGLNIRISRAMWLIFFFIFRAFYESCFFRFFHMNASRPLPLSLKDVFAENYTLFTDHAKYRALEHLPALQSISKVIDGEPIDVIPSLEEHRDRKVAVFTTETFLQHYISTYMRSKQTFAVVAEPVMSTMICMYFPRRSYLVSTFNEQLLRLQEVGISYHIYKDSSQDSDFPRKTDSSITASDEVSPIDLEMHIGIFSLLMISYGFASLIFLLEFCCPRKWKKEKKVACLKV